MTERKHDEAFSDIRRFCNDVYYQSPTPSAVVPGHLQRLARKLGISKGMRVFDVGCGLGDWLMAASERGASPEGIDLSEKAIEVCRARMPHGRFVAGSAESAQVPEQAYDVVTCLGSLEHFVFPEVALRIMARAVKPEGVVLLLVPNSGFLTRRIGLYRGTNQRDVREVVRSISEWEESFQRSGSQVHRRWRDLHVLTLRWIRARGCLWAPLRAVQALLLPLWPLSSQYQVYYLCTAQR